MVAAVKYPNKHWIKRYIHYNPFTGQFIRIQKSSAGRRGTGIVSPPPNGCLRLDNILYRLNKLAWIYIEGSEPLGPLKHIDGNKDNYIFKNLELTRHP